jgi:aerobic-type carbon monoxide dehydrogenase small subunit (CoxS/CutS family)
MVRFVLNDEQVTSESPPDTPLVWVLREELNL